LTIATGRRENRGVLPRALTIAGSDSGGGAGIQADLKTFTVFGVYGSTAITALTAQNTLGVKGVHAVPPEFVRLQLETVLSDIGTDAVKTGMLANAAIIAEVVRAVREHQIVKLVVDPVMVAQSGAALIEAGAVEALRSELIPLALLVTPNAPEAEVLASMKIESTADLRRAARVIVERGARAALVKGGHLEGEDMVDVFDDGRVVQELRAPRVHTRHTHGTGCQLSAAITAGLAMGRPLAEAIVDAKRFISVAIANAVEIGRGDGPANPLAWKF
jgi:hydroxymethylpyrimidine/phosphomethylpyrimidine kinase